MCPRNPGGDSNAPPPSVAVPTPVAFPPEASAPPVHIGHPGPPQIYTGMPMYNVLGTNVGVWTTSLCGCFDDLSNSCACAGILCFLIFNIFICSFCYTCTCRTKLRGLYSIPGNQCGDCCVHLWCEPCALCQEYRELKNRGFNPSIVGADPAAAWGHSGSGGGGGRRSREILEEGSREGRMGKSPLAGRRWWCLALVVRLVEDKAEIWRDIMQSLSG
ncbi:hypothetical protein NL676_003657 [Syzygium grande]|nr:hypothetical protein NL676_003657 [Syzygium grande]